jgi:hypothetical protein
MLLSKLSPLRLILILCNVMGLFKIFGKVMLRLLCIYSKQNPYFDELTSAGWSISLKDFNLQVYSYG